MPSGFEGFWKLHGRWGWSWPWRMHFYEQRGWREEIPGRRGLVTKGAVVGVSLKCSRNVWEGAHLSRIFSGAAGDAGRGSYGKL